MARVYPFAYSHSAAPMHRRELLGGHGADLAEMASVLELSVPPGFTITTDTGGEYLENGWPEGLDAEVAAAVVQIEEQVGQRLGDPHDPLLVSVRSGGKFPTPGMGGTVLNLGLNDASVEGLAARTGDAVFAYDTYRRFLSRYARIVCDLEGEEGEVGLVTVAETRSADDAPGESVEALKRQCGRYQAWIAEKTGRPVPPEPERQLRESIEALFRSGGGARAVAYRDRERIPPHPGTAVNVQAMVFGNRSHRSGAGVGFTRNAVTGADEPCGTFLFNAPGEDVVARISTTDPLDALARAFPDLYGELGQVFARLEKHYQDMCEVEFTIEQGKLWILQTRVGERTGAAALRMAVEMTTHEEKGWSITRAEAVKRITPDHLDGVLHAQFAAHHQPVIATGVGASPGAAVGRAYFSADAAVDAADRGEPVILVRKETTPEDVHGMQVAEGVITTSGGMASHAAVVARGWGIPAVVGASSLTITENGFSVGAITVGEGDVISLDGASGEIVLGAMTVEAAEPPAAFATLLGWADDLRRGRLSVRANADTATDAARARTFGAEGIGLCRTEHMFLAEDRLPILREIILAANPAAELAALERLRVAQKADFLEILTAMDGLPITVRLLDPPLHEFFPPRADLLVKQATEGLTPEEKDLLDAAEALDEQNPMLGTRGVRLGVLHPGLYGMQVRALVEAVLERRTGGFSPVVELMIPLTVTAEELILARSWVGEAIVASVGPGGEAPEISVGTMIETPRAALRASELAEQADFFSIGTNDLTQMTFGFSRDDVEGRLMPAYLAQGLLPGNPFTTIDFDGVGELVAMATERGRAANPALRVGVCGEHGGDPESIAFFVAAGVDYVSCSPFRVPIARLAAAQAIMMQSDSTSRRDSETLR